MSKNVNLSKRVRFFSLTTYCTENQIKEVILKHYRSIRANCYILHDKDKSEPHYHMLIRTYSAWSSNQIIKWFESYKDAKGIYVNTFCEPANDLPALRLYLLHHDKESVEAGKHWYADSELVDNGIWDIIPYADAHDNTYDIINEMLLGADVKSMVRRYGRDFVYHYRQYLDILDAVRNNQGYVEAKKNAALERFIPHELKDDEELPF